MSNFKFGLKKKVAKVVEPPRTNKITSLELTDPIYQTEHLYLSVLKVGVELAREAYEKGHYKAT